MRVFLSGPITNDPNYKEHFGSVAEKLTAKGHVVLNPAILPKGLETEEYMSLGLDMMDLCDCICMLKGWKDSRGANVEYEYAKYCGKIISFEGGN